MPYSTPPALLAASSVCVRTSCEDPAVVALARVELGNGEALVARVCATHARDAVDDLLRRASLAQDTPALALSPIVEEA